MHYALDAEDAYNLAFRSGFQNYDWWLSIKGDEGRGGFTDWKATGYAEDPDHVEDPSAQIAFEITHAKIVEALFLVLTIEDTHPLLNYVDDEFRTDCGKVLYAPEDCEHLDEAFWDTVMQIIVYGAIHFGE